MALIPGVGILLSFHTHPLQAQLKDLRQQGSLAVVVIVTWVAEPGASQLSVCSRPLLLSQPEGFGVGVQINKEDRGCPVKFEFPADNE